MSRHHHHHRSSRASACFEGLENRRLLSASIAAGSALLADRAAGAEAPPITLDSATPHIMPDGAVVGGKTIGEWSGEWWKWAYSFTAGNDPFTGTASPDANQPGGNVYYLAGTAGGSAERTFTVPSGSFVLVPLLNAELSQAELGDFTLSADEVRAASKAQTDNIDSLHATLDGVSISESSLFSHRIVSPAFSFDAVPGNLFGAPAGNSGIAVADGYWLMLSPLSGGAHTINFGGGASAFGFNVDVTDHLSASAPSSVVASTVSFSVRSLGTSLVDGVLVDAT